VPLSRLRRRRASPPPKPSALDRPVRSLAGRPTMAAPSAIVKGSVRSSHSALGGAAEQAAVRGAIVIRIVIKPIPGRLAGKSGGT
jgi:hypothetical protein